MANEFIESLKIKSISAAKWSVTAEVASKLVSPVTTIVLARLLSPNAFGVVATASMVFSFADMLTDAGFQKYLVQQEFVDDRSKGQYATVAFWTNLWISIFIWFVVFVFRDPIAKAVGNPGLGMVLFAACGSLPITSFSSIQMALYKRDFDFRTLFFTRMVGIFIPLLITLPLAFIGFDYWSIIIGTIAGNLSNAVILTVKSKWKPGLFYKFSALKKMFSFSAWSLVEDVSIWLTSWIDVFIIGAVLNSYYLGLYKTSINIVNSMTDIFAAAITPVLFSTLSRIQYDESSFRNVFFKFQRLAALLILPLGAGIYLYRDFITFILLGSKWTEASTFVGLWGLSSALILVFAHFSSEAYRAKGQPKLSFLVQILHLIVLVPALLISARYGFTALIYTRALVRIQMILVNCLFMYIYIKISPIQMIKNIALYCLAAALMSATAVGLQLIGNSYMWDIVSIAICILVYFSFLSLFPTFRKEFSAFLHSFISSKRFLPKAQ